MTDLDLTPAGLRKLAQECITPDTSALAVLLRCSRTLRALAEEPSETGIEAVAFAACNALAERTDAEWWCDLEPDQKDIWREVAKNCIQAMNAAKAKEMGL